jgi:predicted RNase H-like HicB family nuclease
MKNFNTIQFKTEFFEEDGVMVGLAPELNVSSFGDNLEQAKHSLQEAVDLYLEGCAEMGTLKQVLEEAGFQPKQQTEQTLKWLPRKIQRTENICLDMPIMAAA